LREINAGSTSNRKQCSRSRCLDAKRYFVLPTARWSNADGTVVLATCHRLDPWVLSAGVSYRF
jgi:outer membrane protein W